MTYFQASVYSLKNKKRQHCETSTIIITTFHLKTLSQRGVEILIKIMQLEAGRARTWAQADWPQSPEHWHYIQSLGIKVDWTLVPCSAHSFTHSFSRYLLLIIQPPVTGDTTYEMGTALPSWSLMGLIISSFHSSGTFLGDHEHERHLAVLLR